MGLIMADSFPQHQEDLRKTAPTALWLLAVLAYCLRRHALLGQFCVSPLYGRAKPPQLRKAPSFELGNCTDFVDLLRLKLKNVLNTI